MVELLVAYAFVVRLTLLYAVVGFLLINLMSWVEQGEMVLERAELEQVVI